MDRLLSAGIRAAEAGRREEAIKMLTRVVQKDPRSVDGWFYLGTVMPEDKQKIDCFRRAMKFDSNHLEAREELVRLGYLKPEPPKIVSVPAFSFDEPEEESPPVFDAEPSKKESEPAFSFGEPEEAPPIFSFDEAEEDEE
ncbi:MAG TPA: hypothetical protein EYP74_04080, partial [Anaerolineales bacterium]|nr:hypothetical protein [Anaerolineales bacterium]